MRDLYRNEYMAATLDGRLLTIAWSREEPSDDNAVQTIAQLTRALDEHLRSEPDIKVDVLIDLSWASGRIMREYRVLLDPPGVPAAPAVDESRSLPGS